MPATHVKQHAARVSVAIVITVNYPLCSYEYQYHDCQADRKSRAAAAPGVALRDSARKLKPQALQRPRPAVYEACYRRKGLVDFLRGSAFWVSWFVLFPIIPWQSDMSCGTTCS